MIGLYFFFRIVAALVTFAAYAIFFIVVGGWMIAMFTAALIIRAAMWAFGRIEARA